MPPPLPTAAEPASARRRPVLPWLRRWLWLLPLAVGVPAAVTYLTVGTDAGRSTAFLVVAVTAIVSIYGGAGVHRAGGRPFWRLMALSAALFVVGALLRPWVAGQPGPAAALADLFTLAGYLACVTGLVGIAGRHVRSNTFALLDGLLAVVGAGCAVVLLLVLPALAVPGRPDWVSWLAGIYPLLDVVIVLIILQLAFTSAASTWSLRALTASLSCLVVGDAGYAWIGTRGELVGPPVMDLPFFAAYTLFAVAALHPTMVQLTSAVPRPVQPWSRRRLTLIGPALAMPGLLVLVAPPTDLAGRTVLALGCLAGSLLLVRRAVGAVRLHVTAEQTLIHQSTHDALTGMANRVAAMDRIGQLVARAAREDYTVWAVALDLDRFRLVNDTWGGPVGDRLLLAVAERMAGIARRDGAFVARPGGDEFVVAGMAIDEASAVTAALRMAADLGAAARRPVLVDELEFLVTVSVGAATVHGPGAGAVGLLRNADTALGRAKAEGRDRCVLYDPGMSDLVARRLRLGTALRRAVHQDELTVAYQPIVATGSERTLGCEALLRWRLNGEGPVSPAEFIPVAEETGLVVELGAWVLERAAATVQDWRRCALVDPDFYVSVNVSARQLVEDDFLRTVRDVLQRTGLPARNLVLEITESVMLTDPESSIALLEQLRACGVRLSLDDFGTGYSSLSHLDRLPVHTVKLDRSFVSRLDGPQPEEHIVQAVQGLADALGMSVVAEGVETADQLAVLRRLGIGYGQGWLWGAAVPAEDFVAEAVARSSAPATSITVGNS